MKYDISKSTSPKMPNLGKGTECIKLLLSQASKDMHEPLVPMLFPVLGAHVSASKFQYPDNTWKELCGMMANLVGDSGCNKGQFSNIVEAINRNFREHDKEEMDKLVEWQRIRHTKGDNKDKPDRPEIAFWFPPTDTTRPAFLQNAIGCETLGGRTQYFNLPEVEMADGLCGGHKAIAIPSATLLSQADKDVLSEFQVLGFRFHMWPDADVPGERLFLQLKEVLPDLVRHQLSEGCKDYSDYFVKMKV